MGRRPNLAADAAPVQNSSKTVSAVASQASIAQPAILLTILWRDHHVLDFHSVPSVRNVDKSVG